MLFDALVDEFLNEWNCHEKCLSSIRIVDLHGFTKNPDTLNYMVIMDYANKDLMKKCWNEDPLKRPSASEVKYIIDKWISRSFDGTNIRNDIIEFINAPLMKSFDIKTGEN
ncbi:kinase-like domain-containing protein [Rhizophagus clarus]|uniref:Kinase-like domain-containing protein n=1 Tax=Rhizophagus clarus TaxID=94130 RepID=A0A8H3L4U7_9GLOM|nr:kinase-like domain-containing protein [Rhizophagus clarus]